MRAEWKEVEPNLWRVAVPNIVATVYRLGRWQWEVYGHDRSSGSEDTLPAAKLAAERELRRLIGEAAGAMGGTVQWDAATPQ